MKDHILNKNNSEEEACRICNGTGVVDSGGSTPWGEWIEVRCTYCNGSGKDPGIDDKQIKDEK